jgi:hypothetical protein
MAKTFSSTTKTQDLNVARVGGFHLQGTEGIQLKKRPSLTIHVLQDKAVWTVLHGAICNQATVGMVSIYPNLKKPVAPSPSCIFPSR